MEAELRKIRNLIKKGNSDQALKEFIELADNSKKLITKKDINNQLELLSSQLSKWKKEYNLGLEPKEADLRRIELAILELASEKVLTSEEVDYKENLILHKLKKIFPVFLFLIPIIVLLYLPFYENNKSDKNFSSTDEHSNNSSSNKIIKSSGNRKNNLNNNTIEKLTFNSDTINSIKIIVDIKTPRVYDTISVPKNHSIDFLKNTLIHHFELERKLRRETRGRLRNLEWELHSNYISLTDEYLSISEVGLKDFDIIRLSASYNVHIPTVGYPKLVFTVNGKEMMKTKQVQINGRKVVLKSKTENEIRFVYEGLPGRKITIRIIQENKCYVMEKENHSLRLNLDEFKVKDNENCH